MTKISMAETRKLTNNLFGDLNIGCWNLFGAWDLGIGI
jgi:UDP-N-acetyl-D-mannosaminuronate dehydrogenase